MVLSRHIGMSSSRVEPREALATRVEVSEDTLSIDLADGRTIAAPLAWYPRLAHATAAQRGSWRLIGGALAGDRRGYQRREPAARPAIDGKPELFQAVVNEACEN
jgi:hypothetical protein